MATSPSDLLNRAKTADDLGGLVKQGLGGTLLALATGVISGVLSLTDVVVKPLNALGTALADLTTAIFGQPAQIIIAGAQSTVASLTGAFSLGPLTFALSIGSVLAGLYLVSYYRDEEDTGNLLVGLPLDVPFIGDEEEGEQ